MLWRLVILPLRPAGSTQIHSSCGQLHFVDGWLDICVLFHCDTSQWNSTFLGDVVAPVFALEAKYYLTFTISIVAVVVAVVAVAVVAIAVAAVAIPFPFLVGLLLVPVAVVAVATVPVVVSIVSVGESAAHGFHVILGIDLIDLGFLINLGFVLGF